MFCEIIELRRAGLRLAPKDWSDPIIGDLRMYYGEAERNNLRRSLRSAHLYVHVGTYMASPHRLVDPVVIDILGDAMLWRGYETELTPEGLREHEQLWLVRPRDSMRGPLLPKFNVEKFTKKLPEIYVPHSNPSV